MWKKYIYVYFIGLNKENLTTSILYKNKCEDRYLCLFNWFE